MASVIKELWGHHPRFLKLKSKYTLPALLSRMPLAGVGSKVSTTKSLKKGLDKDYYTITEIKDQAGVLFEIYN